MISLCARYFGSRRKETMSVENEQDPFAFFDFSLEETNDANEEARASYWERDGRVCACGHAFNRHSIATAGTVCVPTKMQCPCKSFKPVIEVQDTRDFLRKTTGPGPLHALGRGIATALVKGHWVKWLIAMECEKCHAETQLIPVAINGVGQDGRKAHFDVLLCKSCMDQMY
jgi:hypothetical protein